MTLGTLILLLFCSIQSFRNYVHSEQITKTISTNLGDIRGFLDYSTKGKEFFSFYGIPFAEPPINELRLKDPQPPKPWKVIREIKEYLPICAQFAFGDYLTDGEVLTSGDEDCLYLNVFVPKDISDEDELPVMVFFHGGSYATGGASTYEPHELLNEDIILVVVQYRLGVLGFLSTGDSVMEGNFGLKDQTKALEWVNENIHHFSGDPRKVTIFGQSAGGGSVHYHILSEQSSTLFTRAILQSGTLLCPWAKTRDVREDAMTIGNHFDCFKNGTINSNGEEGSEVLLKCLREVDVKELALSVKLFNEFTFVPLLAGPRVDGTTLQEAPESLLRNNVHKHLDLMFGITRDEGAFMTCVILKFDDQRKAIVEDFERVGPVSLGLHKEENGLEMSEEAYDHFIGGIKNGDDSIHPLTKMYGDVNFGFCLDWAAMYHAKNNKLSNTQHKVYFYELHHRGLRSLGDRWHIPFAEDQISHSDGLYYLFPFNTTNDFHRDEEDSRMRDLMIRLWANFAKYGNPTPDANLGFTWEAFTTESPKHLRLQLNPEMEDDSRKEVREFWESLPTLQNELLFGDKNIEL